MYFYFGNFWLGIISSLSWYQSEELQLNHQRTLGLFSSSFWSTCWWASWTNGERWEIKNVVVCFMFFFSQIALAIGVLTSNRLGAIAGCHGCHCWGAIAGCHGCHCWGAVAGVPLLVGRHGWKPLLGAIAGCHCWMLATNFGGVHVGCHCWVPCWGAISGCHCLVPLLGCHCWVPLREKIDQSVTPFSAAPFSTLITHKLACAIWGLCWYNFRFV